MGFKVTRTTFPLDFTGTQFEGMEVVMKRPDLGALGDLGQLYGINVESLNAEDVARIARAVSHFSLCLVSWNLEVDEFSTDNKPTGRALPVPANAEGVAMLDDYFVLEIMHIWLKALKGDGVNKADIPQVPMVPAES